MTRTPAFASKARSAFEGNLLASKIAYWAKQIKAWGIEWKTGIYPGEMAAFLGLCDLCGTRSIVESGRGEHAYSTQILCEYAQRENVRVVSVDFEPVQGRSFQERVQTYRNLECVTGDAFAILPTAVRRLPGPMALLLDGPKLQPANRLSLVASIMFDFRVIAHHNCPLDAPWGREFAEVFPGAFHYEDLSLEQIGEWREFKAWERQWVGEYEIYDEVHDARGRSLEASSLAMALVGPNKPSSRRLLELGITPLRYHPVWLWTRWHLSQVVSK